MKLKTLKDIKKQDFSKVSQEFVLGFLTALDLSKKEAIKWVKNKREKKKTIETKGAKMYAQGYIDALIDFHNITEEELK